MAMERLLAGDQGQGGGGRGAGVSYSLSATHVAWRVASSDTYTLEKIAAGRLDRGKRVALMTTTLVRDDGLLLHQSHALRADCQHSRVCKTPAKSGKGRGRRKSRAAILSYTLGDAGGRWRVGRVCVIT